MKQDSFLSDMTVSVRTRFKQARSLLSFGEFLEQVERSASTHCRSGTQYLYDAFQYFGTREVSTPLGPVQRFRLFDPIGEGSEHVVIGQEKAQQALFRMLGNFSREGRNTRLLLLHGPNGSGKSSIIQSLMMGLERYSKEDEGALYRFNWIFPAEKLKRSGIGFGQDSPDTVDMHSYAHLEGEQIEAKIPSFLKDHPLLLIPNPERGKFFDRLFETGALPADFQISDYLLYGDLEPRSRMIFDSLLAHYGGHFAEVLRHVQVERIYHSQRYRSGCVSIEPQMHVDASIRQVSVDRSLASLPKPLNNLNLFEAFGALVDANRGMVEYSDLLKRPIEAFKYLLSTCETGRVNVEPFILYLDLLFVGNANELNLDRFKEVSEFISFKSRLELIRVPYILQYSLEQEIYDKMLTDATIQKEIVPHVTRLASLWAVLTRLKRPNPERLPEKCAELAKELKPIEKAQLYNDGTIPSRLSVEQIKILRTHLPDMYDESRNDMHFEGRIGASPREIRSVLFNAAQNDNFPCLSPLALFEELEGLVEQRSVYEFLQLEPKEGYYDPASYIDDIRSEHLRLVDREFRTATGLFKATQYGQELERYIQHVKAYVRNEKVENPITHKSDDPDIKWLQQIEEILLSEDDDAESFRQGLISKIAVFSLDNPGVKVDMSDLFEDYINKLETHAYASQQKRLRRIAEHVLVCLNDESGSLADGDLAQAQQTIDMFRDTFGYPEASIRETVALLLRKRYQETGD